MTCLDQQVCIRVTLPTIRFSLPHGIVLPGACPLCEFERIRRQGPHCTVNDGPDRLEHGRGSWHGITIDLPERANTAAQDARIRLQLHEPDLLPVTNDGLPYPVTARVLKVWRQCLSRKIRKWALKIAISATNDTQFEVHVDMPKAMARFLHIMAIGW